MGKITVAVYFFWLTQLFALNSSENVDGLVQELIVNSKSISAKKLDISQQKKKLESASSFMPPLLGVDYMNMPINKPWPGNHPMSSVGLSLSQQFNSFGTSEAKTKLAHSEIKLAQAALAQQINDEVSNMLAELAHQSFFEEKSQILSSNINNFQALHKALMAKYKLNNANQYELIRVELYKKILQEEWQIMRKKAEAKKRVINGLVYRSDLDSALPDGLQLEKNDLESFSADTIKTSINQNLPQYLMSQHQAQNFEHMAQLESKLAWPKLSLSLQYRFRFETLPKDDGTDFFGLGIQIPLSFIGLGSRFFAIRDSNYIGKEISLQKAVQIETTALNNALYQQELYRKLLLTLNNFEKELLPLSEQAVNAAKKAYEINQSHFQALFDSQKELIALEEKHLNFKLEARLAQIELKKLLGSFGQALGEM